MQIKEAINKYNDWAKWIIIVVCVGALGWQFWYQIVSPEYKFYSAKITQISEQLENFQEDVIWAEERLREYRIEWNNKKEQLIELETDLKQKEQDMQRQLKTLENKVKKLRGELNSGLRKIQQDAQAGLDQVKSDTRQEVNRKFKLWEDEWEKEMSKVMKNKLGF